MKNLKVVKQYASVDKSLIIPHDLSNIQDAKKLKDIKHSTMLLASDCFIVDNSEMYLLYEKTVVPGNEIYITENEEDLISFIKKYK